MKPACDSISADCVADVPSVHSELKNHGMSSGGVPYVVAEDGFAVTNVTRVHIFSVPTTTK